jgi:hypothetical protein
MIVLMATIFVYSVGTYAASAGGCHKGVPLVIGGNIEKLSDDRRGTFDYSEEALAQLPSRVIVTSTDWTPVSTFEGPLLSEVLKGVGAAGKTLRMQALDDYAMRIPWSDADRYGVILARSRNGIKLRPHDFGPLFLIYPRDQYAGELNTSMTRAKFIWQLCRIDVE